MKLSVVIPTILASCSAAAAAAVARSAGNSVPLHRHDHVVLESPTSGGDDDSATAGLLHRIPTRYESAVMGRRILALSPIGTFATVFPEEHDEEEGQTASGGGRTQLSLSEYIADCERGGNPTILAADISAHFRNVRAGSNISVGLRWVPPYPPSKRISLAPDSDPSPASPPSFMDRLIDYVTGRQTENDDDDDGDDDRHDPLPYSAANLPRFSLMGYLEPIGDDGVVTECFIDAHPDARYWLPGNRIHKTHFVRLVVTQVYWVGGFGDRAYIGWIPADEWRSVSRDEWEAIRLPGEKEGWEEGLEGDDWDDWEIISGDVVDESGFGSGDL